MNAPSLRRRPLFVRGMPIVLENLDLNAETPISLQIEKPQDSWLFPHLPLERNTLGARTTPIKWHSRATPNSFGRGARASLTRTVGD
jgi:hypothetical protein